MKDVSPLDELIFWVYDIEIPALIADLQAVESQ